MTQEQKNTIIKMRNQGHSYAIIGDVLGISKNTVKTFCNRNGLGGNLSIKKDSTDNKCKYCGAELEHTEGHRKKRFCNKKCSNAWWNAQTEKTAANMKSFVCPGCGKTFVASTKKRRKYCTFDCYIKDRFYKGGDAE